MPLVVRNGDLSLGHCWPPATAIATQQTTVFANNKPVVVVNDLYTPHPGPCGIISPHNVKTVQLGGSTTIFIEVNKRPYREGDLLNCGDVAKVNEEGQNYVFFDGLGASP